MTLKLELRLETRHSNVILLGWITQKPVGAGFFTGPPSTVDTNRRPQISSMCINWHYYLPFTSRASVLEWLQKPGDTFCDPRAELIDMMWISITCCKIPWDYSSTILLQIHIAASVKSHSRRLSAGMSQNLIVTPCHQFSSAIATTWKKILYLAEFNSDVLGRCAGQLLFHRPLCDSRRIWSYNSESYLLEAGRRMDGSVELEIVNS